MTTSRRQDDAALYTYCAEIAGADPVEFIGTLITTAQTSTDFDNEEDRQDAIGRYGRALEYKRGEQQK